MKVLILLAATAALFAQDSKMVSAPTVPAAQTERGLSETEVLKIQLTMAQIQVLRDKFKLDDYEKELKPIVDEQQKVAIAACRSVGVPEDKITTECSLVTGMGADGKPTLGADGKPVMPKVWWVKPQPGDVTKAK